MAHLIRVTVKPGQRHINVEQTAAGLVVKLTAAAHDGAANIQLIEIMAKHLHLPKSSLELIKGHTGRIKTIRVQDI